MATLNHCSFIGRCGKDVELRYTPSGDAVATVSLAVDETWKNKQGEKQSKTEWINVVAWRGLAEIMGKYVSKGDLIYISGKLQTRNYDDRDGNKRYITEIVADQMQMLGGGERKPAQETRTAQSAKGRPPEPPPFDPDDDIPF